MPVLLATTDFEPGLSGAASAELLRPAPNDLLARWPVSKRVNSSRASDDDSSLIAIEGSVATPDEIAGYECVR
jgi:putative SOS response-associated peptidase YedK